MPKMDTRTAERAKLDREAARKVAGMSRSEVLARAAKITERREREKAREKQRRAERRAILRLAKQLEEARKPAKRRVRKAKVAQGNDAQS